MLRAGSAPVGLDLSRGMLAVARRSLGNVLLAQADLDAGLPVKSQAFDAVLCALVGEHLETPAEFFAQAHSALLPGGRLVFSVFHPEMAQAGIEANFERAGTEYRLGAHRHTVADYLTAIEDAGFAGALAHEWRGDEALAAQVPAAKK
jgi:SAM-dependent methyltransferase